jgi:hypothetical protein
MDRIEVMLGETQRALAGNTDRLQRIEEKMGLRAE